MSVHVCHASYNGKDEYHIRYPGWTEKDAQRMADQINSGALYLRELREGEVMAAYMEFDRTASKSWTNAEYLVQFGIFISNRTIKMNNERR